MLPRRLLAAAILLAPAGPVLADLTVASQSYGLGLVLLDDLPPAPTDQGEAEFCSHLFVTDPETPAGRAAQDRGWQVTAELPFGDLTAVSFIGGAVLATSGTCELYDGNVGLFAGHRLVALAYGLQRDDLMIGRIRPFGSGDLRVLSGDPLPYTMADLTRAGDSILATDPAPDEPVCNAAAIVPRIEGFPIDEARVRLMRGGWSPVPGDPGVQAVSQARDIASAGVPEVEDCAGTGFAFCRYAYTGDSGALTVITAGEGGESGGLPLVFTYDVACH